jgi:hypothetical protein
VLHAFHVLLALSVEQWVFSFADEDALLRQSHREPLQPLDPPPDVRQLHAVLRRGASAAFSPMRLDVRPWLISGSEEAIDNSSSRMGKGGGAPSLAADGVRVADWPGTAIE